MRKLTHLELVSRQRAQNGPRLPLTVVLNDIRSLYNVGSIFRTSDGAGVEKLWICGITGFPPDSQISKTALGAESSVPWEYHPDVCAVVRRLKAEGYQAVLLEQTEQSLPYESFEPDGPLCLILGNEISGVSEELTSLCDRALEIDMAGVKNSLNVTVAYGIVAYHFRTHLKKLAAKGKQLRE